MTAQNEKLEQQIQTAKRALEAIENCLKHARLDSATVKDLEEAAEYERDRISRLEQKLARQLTIPSLEIAKRIAAIPVGKCSTRECVILSYAVDRVLRDGLFASRDDVDEVLMLAHEAANGQAV